MARSVLFPCNALLLLLVSSQLSITIRMVSLLISSLLLLVINGNHPPESTDYMAQIAEFDSWMDLERIARSDFAMLLFEGMKAGVWSSEDAMELSVAALHGFGNGCCYFLASAVASTTGYPIAGFLRKDGSLIHAAVVNPTTMMACDILGSRPVGALRMEMRSIVKDASLVVLPVIDTMDFDIATGLPWMPLRQQPIPFGPWGRLLVDYVEARMGGFTDQP